MWDSEAMFINLIISSFVSVQSKSPSISALITKTGHTPPLLLNYMTRPPLQERLNAHHERPIVTHDRCSIVPPYAIHDGFLLRLSQSISREIALDEWLSGVICHS